MESPTLAGQSPNEGASTSVLSSQAPSTIDIETPLKTQSFLKERLQMIQNDVYPFLTRPPEDAHFVPEALKRYINENKIYGVSDDVENVTRKLNSYLNDTIQILSKASGAAIYALALWDDGKSGTEIFECCSTRVAGYISEGDSMEALRSFGDYVHVVLGPVMNRSLEQAWPTCYGTEIHDFRPRLPPRHPLLAQERMFVDEYLEYLWKWQGYKDTPPWEDVADDIKTGAYNWVEARRLPANPPSFLKPTFWSEDEIVSFAAYVREHQDRFDSEDLTAETTAFQWREKDDEGKFRRNINPINELVYPEESSFYYLAMKKYKFPQDHYVSQPPIFNEAARKAVIRAGVGIPDVARLMNLLEAYKLLPYPEREATDEDPMLLQMVPNERLAIADWLDNASLPPNCRNWKHKDWNRWTVAHLHLWLDNGNLIDPTTGLPYGGYGGALRVFLAALKMWSEVTFDVSNPRLLRKSNEWKFTFNEQSILTEIFDLLKTKLTPATSNKSILRQVKRRAKMAETLRTHPWQPKKIKYMNMLGYSGPLKEDTLSRMDDDVPAGGDSLPRILKRPRNTTAGDNSTKDASKHQEHVRSHSGDQLGHESGEEEIIRQPQSTVLRNPYLPPEPEGTRRITLMKRVQDARKLVSERPLPAALPDIPEVSQPRRSRSEPRSDVEPLENALQLELQNPETQLGSPVLIAPGISPPSFQLPAASSTPHGRGRSLIRPKPAWTNNPSDEAPPEPGQEDASAITRGAELTPNQAERSLPPGETTPKAPARSSLAQLISAPLVRKTRSASSRSQQPASVPSPRVRTPSMAATAGELSDISGAATGSSFLLGRAGQLLAKATSSALVAPADPASVSQPASLIQPRSSAPVRKTSKRRTDEKQGGSERKKTRSGSRSKK